MTTKKALALLLINFACMQLLIGCNTDTGTTRPTSRATSQATSQATPAITQQSAVPSVQAAATATSEESGQVVTPEPSAAQSGTGGTVFVIAMENHNWADIEGSDSAPYLNKVVLPMSSYARQYYNPPQTHPSEPNYLWLEAGTSFGINNDDNPNVNHQASPDHLTTLLSKAGISWKTYAEGISGTNCPLVTNQLYAPKHNPMVFFDDVTNHNDPASAYCIAHERPYSELQNDLQGGSVARYNFIVPDLCHDMHNTFGCASLDSVRNGDDWLSSAVPQITDSRAYKDGGALFITWDEGENNSDGPIGMLLLSPKAKGAGYTNTIHYTHGSTLRTIQEMLGVTPLLGGAGDATDLSGLFATFP